MTVRKVSILGVDFVHTTMNGMIETLAHHLEKEEKAFVVTANPEIVLHAYENEAYNELLQQADYITADGIGVVKAAKWLGKSLPERVTGFDMFMKLLHIANERSYSIYLLGAKEEVIERAVATIGKQFPNIKIAGYHHGYFDWNDKTIENEVKETKPDLMFLAIGFPRQEQWISERIDSFSKGIFMGVGGSFDVLAGEVRRAPLIWQKLNLEWLYRLLKQPSRWRRMLALPKFVLTVWGQKLKGKQ